MAVFFDLPCWKFDPLSWQLYFSFLKSWNQAYRKERNICRSERLALHGPVGVHIQKLCNWLAWICQNTFGRLWLCCGLFTCFWVVILGMNALWIQFGKFCRLLREGKKKNPPEKPHHWMGLRFTGLIFCACCLVIKPLPHLSSSYQYFEFR